MHSLIACLVWFAGDAVHSGLLPRQRKSMPFSETDKLVQEKNDVRKARFKLLQDESAYQVQYFKPVDRLRRQLDMQENDLYADVLTART